MSAGPSLDAIREAHARIELHIHRTPICHSSSLDQKAGARLFFKCENLQKTGSFKMRGAANVIFSLTEAEAARGVVTPSSGNHGTAVAYAARERGIRAWIVLPRTAPEVKRRAILDFGAEIVPCEYPVESRMAVAKEVLARTGATMVHPYDDDRIIAAQATAAVELLEDAGDLDVVLAPVSGGGLLCGTAIAAKCLQPSIKVIGCEPKNADDAYRSLHSGRLQGNQSADTIADGLRAALSDRTFAILRERLDDVVTITEQEILQAMQLFWERTKLVIEPSSAVPVAAALLGKIDAPGARIGIIVSGGNVDIAKYFDLLRQNPPA